MKTLNIKLEALEVEEYCSDLQEAVNKNALVVCAIDDILEFEDKEAASAALSLLCEAKKQISEVKEKLNFILKQHP
ncbi:MAG: hypothetical protein ACK5LP_07735 [Campylobacteraceae bacterium]